MVSALACLPHGHILKTVLIGALHAASTSCSCGLLTLAACVQSVRQPALHQRPQLPALLQLLCRTHRYGRTYTGKPDHQGLQQRVSQSQPLRSLWCSRGPSGRPCMQADSGMLDRAWGWTCVLLLPAYCTAAQTHSVPQCGACSCPGRRPHVQLVCSIWCSPTSWIPSKWTPSASLAPPASLSNSCVGPAHLSCLAALHSHQLCPPVAHLLYTSAPWQLE